MYLALYRKWRPMVFDDVVAQSHITTPLKNQVKSGKTAHAYLFTGSRGTGKTTCSKILAKAINCPNQENGNPCLECDICRGIDDGSLLDVVEIDAASNNGVDNIREIREEASFTPAVCKYRVYIIDEAHMLSDGAFNALLKIMEEPPAHAVFILATTEVQKIPATILSRCQRFDFKRISAKAITDRLLYISKQEAIKLDDDAALLIAKVSDGGMRDALSLLDRCTAMSGHIDVPVVSSAAGIAGRAYLFKLSEAIIEKNVSEALKITDELHSEISDLGSLCDELIAHFRNILISKTVTKPGELIVAAPDEIEEYISSADRTTLPQILSVLETLENCAANIKKTTAKRLEFEMALIRICSPESDDPSSAASEEIGYLNNKIKELENIIASVSSGERAASGAAPAASYSGQTGRRVSNEASGSSRAEKVDYSKFKPVECFDKILEKLKQTDPALFGMLFDAKAFEYEDIMLIATEKNLFSGLMRNKASAEHLSDAVFKQLGKRYRFKIKNSAKRESKSENESVSPLDELEKAAKDAGVLS